MFNFEINFLVCNADYTDDHISSRFLRKFELKCRELNQTGPHCVRCPTGHRTWSLVVFFAHQ